MKPKDFNFWFNIFILAGMTAAMVATTAFKMSASESGKALLLISAFGSLAGVLANVCSANGMILTFLFSLLDVSIYGVVCLFNWYSGGAGLGNSVLHFLYFVPMQFVGFFQWKKRGAARSGEKLRARRQTSGQRLFSLFFLIAGSAVSYAVISSFDRSAAENIIKWAVLFDAVAFVCNIAGQWLMSAAYMEQWFFWIGVNVASIVMWSFSYASGADSSFALIYIIKYSFYLVNSMNGLRIWLGLSRPDESV